MAFSNASERRRRVLNDQTLGDSQTTAKQSKKAASEGPRYAKDVLESQRRICDLLPRHWGTLSLLSLLLVLGVVALAVCHAYLPDLKGWVAAERLSAFDLAANGSLATWFATLVLIVAAGASLAIYSVRRHRQDDYPGRYRVWTYAAFAWLVVSAERSTGLHNLIEDVAGRVSPWPWLDAAYFWLIPAGVFGGLLLMRLTLEVRESLASLVLLLLAISAWACSGAMHLGWQPLEGQATATLLAGCLPLAGHVLLLCTLLTYGRHVIREAAGEIQVKARVPKEKKEKKPRSAKAKRETKSTDESKSAGSASGKADEKSDNSKSKQRQEAAKTETEWTDGSDGGDDWGDQEQPMHKRQKLSKSQRKRLRKQKAQQRRAA